MKTNIYVESNTRYIREKERIIGYVVDYEDENGNQVKDRKGEPVVKWGWGKRDTTYTGGVLIALAFAMSRADMTEEVVIHSENKFLIGSIDTRLEQWMENDFTKKNGEEIRYLNAWKYIGKKLEGRKFDTVLGGHPYYGWMMEEMKKFAEGGENVCQT